MMPKTKAKKGYEVWIKNGLRMQRWAELGGAAGPMSKAAAEGYVKALMEAGGVTGEVREMR